MCAVAGRGLFRGYGADDLAALGIGFSLYNMPALAVLTRGVVCEEQALRRPIRLRMSDADAPTAKPAHERERETTDRIRESPMRLAVVTAVN